MSSSRYEYDEMSTTAKVGCGIAVVALILAMFVGIKLWSSYHRVEPGQVGIKIFSSTDKGRIKYEVWPQGSYVWVTDWWGEYWQTYPTRLQILKMVSNSTEGQVQGDDSVPCQDNQAIPMRYDMQLNWHVASKDAYTVYSQHPNTQLTGGVDDSVAGLVVRQAARSALSQVCSTRSWVDLRQNKAKLQKEVKEIIIEDLKDNGVTVDAVYLGDVHLESAQQDAINQLSVAQAKLQQTILEKQTAEADAQKDIAKAEGEKKVAVLKAEGDAEAMKIIAKEIRDNPELLTWKWLDKWDGKMPGVLVTDKNGNQIVIPMPQQDKK